MVKKCVTVTVDRDPLTLTLSSGGEEKGEGEGADTNDGHACAPKRTPAYRHVTRCSWGKG